MKWMSKVLGIVLGGLAAFAGVSRVHGAGNSNEAFNQLKTLVGHWHEQKGSEYKSTLDIELTSGGTALIERSRLIDHGKPVEMITMYYLDGEQLKLTHYCGFGNQPTMLGTYAPDAKTLTFNLVSITNLKNPNDGHMYHAVYKFIDDDHVQTIWTFRKDQKDAFTEDVTYARK